MPDRTDLSAIRKSAAVVSVIAVFTVVYFTRDLLLPIMLGFLIALTLSPIERAFVRAGIPTGLTAGALVLSTTAAVLAILMFASGTVVGWIDEAPQIGRQLEFKLRAVFDTVEAIQEASKEVEDLGSGSNGEVSQEVIVEQPGLLNTAVTNFASIVTTLGVALVLAFFILASGNLIYEKLAVATAPAQDKSRVLSMFEDIQTRVSRYLLTITVINACLGVAIGSALWLIGLEHAYIWGIAAFLLNFLPFIGGLIGTVLVAAYAIISFDNLAYALIAPAAYQLLTTIEGQFLTPSLVGRHLEINTVAVFLAVVIWTWLWGIAGALLAIPILLVFKAVCDEFDSLRVYGHLLGR